MRRAAAPLAALVLVAGCGGSSDSRKHPAPRPSDARLIRGWIENMNAGRYARAAAYFARDAVVEQDTEIRLRNRSQAEAFLRSLPCHADLTRVKDEGKTSLAAFRLRRGPGGPCNGIVEVRFTIRHGKFTEWRQRPGRGAQPGVEV
jgi:SnoaL-like protein